MLTPTGGGEYNVTVTIVAVLPIMDADSYVAIRFALMANMVAVLPIMDADSYKLKLVTKH